MSNQQMKDFIEITDDLLRAYVSMEPVMIVEDSKPIKPMVNPIIMECKDLVFKLRAFMEDASSGDYALGLEMGMQRAADMIENLIRRHEKEDDDRS
jgi:hypothetical protein